MSLPIGRDGFSRLPPKPRDSMGPGRSSFAHCPRGRYGRLEQEAPSKNVRNGNGRQVAMVLVGYAANETLGHWWLGTMGRDMLPMRIGNWSVTQDVNLGFMIGWPVVLGFLVWYAWFRKERIPAL